MRKIAFHCFACLLLATTDCFAQPPTENPNLSKFMTEAAKDPAYKRFKAQLDSITKTVKGKTTKATEVKALFSRNKTMLQALYKKYDLADVKAGNINNQVYSILPIKNSILINLKSIGQTDYPYQYKPPYTDKWATCYVNNTLCPVAVAPSGDALGKIEFTVPAAGINSYLRDIGMFHSGFLKKIKVPSNPVILAAKIKFEYSFFYTGWDTREAKTGIDLAIQASTNFNSVSFNELPAGPNLYSILPVDRWRTARIILPMNTITTDFDELHASVDSSFTIEGYVTPGSELQFRFGFGYLNGSLRGINGCYHFGEFILKKITITYYKSGQ